MRDIFHDPQFEEFLYGGMHDLDEQVGGIVYKLYKAGFIKTTWSSEGHIGRSVEGYSARRAGYYVYNAGNMHFESTEDELNEKGALFIDRLSGLVEKYPFATLKKDADSKKGMWLTLEMKDLVEPMEQVAEIARGDIAAAFEQGMYELDRRKEVKIDLAEERLAQFYRFWQELEVIVDEVIGV